MKKILCFILFLAIATTMFSSCSCSGDGDMGEVAVFYYTYSDTYISSVRSELDSLLKKAGIKYNNYDAGGLQTTQTEQIDTAIAKGASLLVVNVVDTGSDDAAKNIIAKAKAASIPVIFFNRSVSEEVVKSYDKCVFVGTDYEMAGHLQGQMIGEYLLRDYAKYDINGDGAISYVMFKGQQGNAEAEARTKYGAEDASAALVKAGKSALKFYDSKNASKYLVDQNGTWSNAAANDYMKTILSGYSEKNGNMIELVIANNDEMALGAIAALEEAGYNKSGGRTIPVFGIDATEAARAKIAEGKMAGTVRQDGAGMAAAMMQIVTNMQSGKGALEGLDTKNTVGGWRVNIPYSLYTGEK